MLSQELRDRHNVVALLVAAVTIGSLVLHGASGPAQGPGVPVSLVAGALFVTFLVPAVQVWLRGLVKRLPALAIWIPAAFALYGVAATAALGAPRWFNLLAWPVCIGAALLAIGRRADGELPPLRFLGAGVALWILAGIWDRAVQIRVPGDARLGLAYLTCVALALFLFAIARPRRSFDVRLGLSLRELGIALGAVAVLAGVAIPLGILVGFLHWEPRWLGLSYAVARIFGLILFVGIPEELLFRGVYQEAFSRLWSPRTGWIVASVLFGLVHIVKHYPPLNWQYALLASVAGLAYGWVYARTGKLGAAAVTHGVVDWLWSTWLGS
ncbi:MAG: CPBP family intramembrane glutamic endopeptidase [Gemmatimonadales bacterium]|jgi:membrane protease YdiL (CAAX protease family)